MVVPNTMWRLHNTIQRYAWGSHEAIAQLQGRPTPTDEPEAELWMGAHARAPSRLGDADERSLLEAIDAEPEAMLGAQGVERFGPRLPFLLKVLAAAQPLSLQAHPDDQRAREGFAREDAAGIDRGARHRNYRDPYAKPELVCAMGPFVALCGFRAVEDTQALIETLGVPALRERAEPLWRESAGDGVAALVRDLLTMPEPRPLVDAVVKAAASGTDERWALERSWTVRLGDRYPGDPGIVVALLLNLIELSKGEALFLSAGQLHCYLEGTAVEIMGGSDNVLRGGLTPKHVDVPELLDTLDRSTGPVPVVRPRDVSEHEAVWDTPSPAFMLSRVTMGARASVELVGRGPEVLLCTDGEMRVQGGEHELSIGSGDSVFVPGSRSSYVLGSGKGGTVFRASPGASSGD